MVKRHKDVAGLLFPVILSGLCVASCAPNKPMERPVKELGKVQLVAQSDPEFQKQSAQMRQKLADPRQREVIRAEQRIQVQQRHPDLAAEIGLDAELEKKLIDLLTEQQLEHLDRFYAERQDDFRAGIQEHAQAAVRNNQQLRELLGEERLLRYLDYMDSSTERQHVAWFEQHLQPADKLTADQKKQLMKILRSEQDRIFSRPSRLGMRLPKILPFSAADREADLLKENIRLNEDSFRRMVVESRALVLQVADVLTPAQLQTFERLETHKIAAQRKHVQQMRRSAGLSPEFDEKAADEPTAEPVLAAGRVRVAVSIRVNDSKPFEHSVDIDNGKAADVFEGPEGLWIEATPYLYEEDWGQVQFKFYEIVQGQRRAIPGAIGRGIPPLRGDPSLFRQLGRGGSSSTISGLKVYQIYLSSTVSPL